MGCFQDDAATGCDVRRSHQYDLPSDRFPVGGSLQVITCGFRAVLSGVLPIHRVESGQGGHVRVAARLPVVIYCVNAQNNVNPGIEPHPQWRALGKTDLERCANYRLLVEHGIEPSSLEKIRYGVRKGIPTGPEHFRSQIEKALKRRIGDGRRGRPSQKGL